MPTARPIPSSTRPTRFGTLLLVLLAALAAARPSPVTAAGKTTLVLGIDISDSRTFDPARQFEYSPPS